MGTFKTVVYYKTQTRDIPELRRRIVKGCEQITKCARAVRAETFVLPTMTDILYT